MGIENRRLCARLIQEVLAGRRITREALKRFPKGEKDKIKSHAETNGESVNGFIKRAIDETIQRDNINL